MKEPLVCGKTDRNYDSTLSTAAQYPINRAEQPAVVRVRLVLLGRRSNLSSKDRNVPESELASRDKFLPNLAPLSQDISYFLRNVLRYLKNTLTSDNYVGFAVQLPAKPASASGPIPAHRPSRPGPRRCRAGPRETRSRMAGCSAGRQNWH